MKDSKRSKSSSPRQDKIQPAPAPSIPLHSNAPLTLALIASVVLHALIMSIHFTAPENPFLQKRERNLEIVLVNARHNRAPDDADALAQANLDGGGTLDEKVTPTTPVPPQDAQREGDTLLEATPQTVERPVEKQQVITQNVKPAPARPTPEPTKPTEAPPTPNVSGQDLLESISAAARLEAQIERNLQAYASRPRRKAIGARTKEYRFAQYIEDWRQKVERVGTLNYPQAARGRLYGSVLVMVSIKADGSVENVSIRRSSGEKILDQAADRIIRMAAPFSPFPPNIKTDVDILDISSTLTFTHADRLGAKLSQ